MTDAQPDASVADVPERNRYEITADGRLAGFCEYTVTDGLITFTHTEVFGEFSGRGLAGTLVAAALDDVRRQGLRARPLCPYVAAYIKRHTAYADLVA